MNDGYRWEVNSIGVVFEVDRLRRERHELIGELGVKCDLPGSKTVNGYLLIGDFNFSSVQARSTRAKLLAERARSNGQIDWLQYLEDFTQRVTAAERQGDPACNIWDIPIPEQVDDFAIAGIALPRKHPSILFGDGGSAKSYVALYIAGKLALQGIAVALFDWELTGDEHRDRCARLFGNERPPITYCRCENSLVNEIDRIHRIVRDQKIIYGFFDSIAFACDGRPEEAEIASKYYRALRRLNIGSLHIAHINKSEDSDKKPFGSNFWYNGARGIWYVQAEEAADDSLDLGFIHRKSNLGKLRQPVGLNVRFDSARTFIEKAHIGDMQKASEKMTIAQRISSLLGRGAMTIADIAEELGQHPQAVRKTVERGTGKRFVIIQGGTGEQNKVGLMGVQRY